VRPQNPNFELLAQIARLRRLIASRNWRAAYQAADALERMQWRCNA
jgi:hypothetical protein